MKVFNKTILVLLMLLSLFGCTKCAVFENARYIMGIIGIVSKSIYYDAYKSTVNDRVEKEQRKLGMRKASEEDLMGFYRSLITRDVAAVEKYLEAGMNPDFLSKKNDYYDRNPLTIVAMANYGYRGYEERAKADTEIMKLLIKYGANVNLRPYIWWVLDHRILTEEDYIAIANGSYIAPVITEDIMYEKVALLIQAGADVDRKGAVNRILFPPTEANYNIYYKRKGTRPINLAILRNLPTMVDLLSQYTKLDKQSLEMAKQSGDPLMIEKINEMWKKQTQR